jgi:hypothetical protein
MEGVGGPCSVLLQAVQACEASGLLFLSLYFLKEEKTRNVAMRHDEALYIDGAWYV